MTEKEALDSLKFEVFEECHCGYIEEELKIAIEALEKQIAKEPKINRVSDDTEYMKCPQCKLTTVLYSDMRPDYCPKCGQKLNLEA